MPECDSWGLKGWEWVAVGILPLYLPLHTRDNGIVPGFCVLSLSRILQNGIATDMIPELEKMLYSKQWKKA